MSDRNQAGLLSAPKKSSTVAKRRLPATPGGFSVNFCRNALCDRFGAFPDPHDGRGKLNKAGRGKVNGSGEETSYLCPSCGLFSSVKSNRAIAQEYSRIRRQDRRTNGQHCETEGCANKGVSRHLSPGSYSSFGKTAKGDPRFQCKDCKTTFSIGKPTKRHKQTSDTGAILKSLVNKVPLSRICEIHDVSLKQIHSKIDFLYRQVVAFAHDREKRLDKCFQDQDAFFATDLQVILVNWPVKSRRGTIPLLHMATVHKFSQFVVAATVDYDPTVSPIEIEKMMEECGDFALARCMRRHGRLWAASEYQDSLMRSQNARFSKDDIATAGQLQLPGVGCRVRGDVFKHAHMMFVKKLVGDRFRTANYCLDDEAGLASAVCALNVKAVQAGKVNIAEISFKKGMTNDDRMALAADGRRILAYTLAVEAETLRDRRGEILFIDARKMGALVPGSRKQKELSPAEVARITRAYHAWRGEPDAGPYVDEPGFCKAASLVEIEKHNCVLTPGRYVGAGAAEDDGEVFEEKFDRLMCTLRTQFAEGRRLEAEIEARLGVLE